MLNLNFKINLDKEPMVFGQETMPILMEINSRAGEDLSLILSGQ
jgi:hypothetical protein